MKKFLSIIMALVMALLFAACENGENPAGLQGEEGDFDVEVVMPASFFEDMSPTEIMDAAEEYGFISCEINPDGSVKYVMTKEKHKEMLDGIKAGFDEGVKTLLEGEDKVASFVSVEYSEDFTEVSVFVDGGQYSIWDSLYAMTFYFSGAYYQSFAGVPEDEIDIVVNFIDNATKEILETSSYQEFQKAGAGN